MNMQMSTTSTKKASLFHALQTHDAASTAIINSGTSTAFSYGNLVADVIHAKAQLLCSGDGGDLTGERVAFLAENSYDYVGMYYLRRRTLNVFLLDWRSIDRVGYTIDIYM